MDRGAITLLGLMVADETRGATTTLDALRARIAAKPLAKRIEIKLAS